LSPVSAVGGLTAATPEMPLSWDEGLGVIPVPAVNMQNVSGFVGEAAPMPVMEGSSSTVSLKPHKYGCIVPLTSELFRYSHAPELIQRALLEGVGASIDSILFSSNAATASAPAGLMLGIAPVTPTTLTTPNTPDTAMDADMSLLGASVAGVAANGGFAYVMSPRQWNRKMQRPAAQGNFLYLPSAALPDRFVDAIRSAFRHGPFANRLARNATNRGRAQHVTVSK
jgi:HK97 family phage major capsid protein